MPKHTFRTALALPPRCEQLFPSDRWLKAVSEAGYTHLCLQNDPFFHPEMDLRDWGENGCRLLSVYDMCSGPRYRSYLEWLKAIGERAGRHGLKMALQLWEPRLTRLARHTLPSEWKGPALHGGWVEPLCYGHPDARAWFLRAVETLIETAPSLDRFVFGINDNNAFLCDETCPRCKGKPVYERLAEILQEVEAAGLRVRPQFRLIVYDWTWSHGAVGKEVLYQEAILSRLSKDTPILTRMRKGALHIPDPAHQEWRGEIFDMSTACEQLGPHFQRAREAAQRFGNPLLVMLPLSGMFEALLEPHVPAVGKIAKTFQQMRDEGVDGWVDFDCGGIHEGLMLDLVRVVQHVPDQSWQEWVRQTAKERYKNETASSAALAIWNAFDAAVDAMPVNLAFKRAPRFSGIGGALAVLILHPFLPERALSASGGNWTGNWSDPHQFLLPEIIPAVRHCLSLALTLAEQGFCTFKTLHEEVPAESRAAVELDRDISELVMLNWRSASNFYAWGASIQGDESIDRAAVLRDEIRVVRRYKELADRPELEHGNMTHALSRSIEMSVPWMSGDYYLVFEHNHLAQWRDPSPISKDLIGNPFAWKIAHLEGQLVVNIR